MKRLALIAYLWVCWGFALGAYVLLVPVRKTVDHARLMGWSSGKENLAVIIYMILLVAVSLGIAWYSSTRILNPTSAVGRAMHVGIPPLAAGFALYLFMHPGIVNADNSKTTSLGTQFTIGPYPDEARLKALKDEGYTAVVALLHPAVVPFEPKLISDEAANAQSVGIKMINIPMLPWVSDNQDAIDSLRRLIHHANGRYYIHCYLGKDRVNVARRIIESEHTGELVMAQGLKRRSIEDKKAFERGPIYKLAEGVYFSPMPTKEEYLGYVVATDFKQVVSLSDLSDGEAVAGTQLERRWIAPYGIPLKIYDLKDNSDNNRISLVVDSIKQLPKPILIHSFRSDMEVAKNFMAAYK